MLTIYHNPRCRKSREALTLLQDSGEEINVREYLKEPPSREELKEVLRKLGLHPTQVIRKGESIYKEQFKGREFSQDQWVEIMVANPILIERPIVVRGEKAVLGRPTENISTLL